MSLVCGSRSKHISHLLFIPTEDAKRLAIKEEQYDPGYEDAYGGAYVVGGPKESQANGHCTFSAAENSGNKVTLLNPRKALPLLSVA